MKSLNRQSNCVEEFKRYCVILTQKMVKSSSVREREGCGVSVAKEKHSMQNTHDLFYGLIYDFFLLYCSFMC